MSLAAKRPFFDGLADRWDGFHDLEDLGRNLASGLERFAVGADETVLDVGCGTGNLTLALLRRLSPRGRVVAVDISPRMIERARTKVADARVTWHLGDAARVPMRDGSCDRVLCFAVWPHFESHAAVVKEFARVLRPGGPLHVWHMIGRLRVNEIHENAGPAVRADVLVPASETAALLASAGFRVSTCTDTQDAYLVTATRAES